MTSAAAARRGAWALPFLAAALLLGLGPALAALRDVPLDPGAAIDALASPALWARLGRSLTLAAATGAIALPCALLLAWALVRADLPFRRAGLVLVALPLFVPPLVHVLAWFELSGLRGTEGIVLVHTISAVPFVTLAAARALERVGRAHAETMELLGGPALVLRDDLRHALAPALGGVALAAALQLSDFAVADFLTAVGPKVTVYADSLLAHHAVGDVAGAAAAALPGTLAALVGLAFALRIGARTGATVESRFEAAPPVALGPLRPLVGGAAAVVVLAFTVLPVAALLRAAGSLGVVLHVAWDVRGTVGRTVLLGALVAAATLVLAVPLAVWRRDLRRPRVLDLAVAASLALPAVLTGIGCVRLWNRPGLDALYLGLGGAVVALAGRYLVLTYVPAAWAVDRLGSGVLDAARLAGAGPFRRIAAVVLPLTGAQVVGAACVALCFALRELDALVMLRGAHDTLTYRLHRSVIFAPRGELASLALTSAVVTMAPFLLVVGVAAWRGGRR